MAETREERLAAQLRANADLTEKAMEFMDEEGVVEAEVDICLWRDSAALLSELAALREQVRNMEDNAFDGTAIAGVIDERDVLLSELVAFRKALEPMAKAGKRLVHEGRAGYQNGSFDDRYESYRFRIGDVIRAYRVFAEGADEQEKR